MSNYNETEQLLNESQIRNIEITQLGVCHEYQRDLHETHWKKILANFDEDALGLLIVGKRQDGSLWVVDGQQRLEAIKRLGWGSIQCKVFLSDGVKHEAKIYRLLNAGRKKIGPALLFKAKLAEGDRTALRIKHIVETNGFKFVLNSSGATHYWPYVGCADTLQRIYLDGMKLGYRSLLQDTLQVVRDAWEGDVEACRGLNIEAVARFLVRATCEVDKKWLAKKLSKTSPTQIQRNIKDAKKMIGSKWFDAMAEVICALVNKGRRAGNRISLSGGAFDE